ncbi:MAG: cell surface protein SprA [Paludibacteraceae bacterium]|nr:cell surface protein SprA [Paludibacteraceae bacterium]
MKSFQRFLNVLLAVSISLTVGIGAIGANTLAEMSLYSPDSEYFVAAPDSTTAETEPAAKTIDSIPAPPGVHQVSRTAIDDIDDYTTEYPIDLADPDNINRGFDYDPITGEYVLHSRVGDMDINTPIRLSPNEYETLTRKNNMRNYWREKNKEALDNYEDKFDITDMKFSLGPAEKVFGPGGVRIKMQGSAELKFGIKYNNIQNYTLSERLRKTTTFDFDENIQLNVNASVGDRIKFGMNYNTEASFEYDQTKIKLAYEGKDDDIIKAIEVGNVSLPLNTQLITGSQALFGMRAALQFGKLSIDAVVAQQQAQSQHVNSQGGAQLMDFEVDVNNYDENRHFFLAHYFRDNFENSMATMPYVTSGITITRCEVWVTNKRNNFEQTRNFVAFMDIGESDKISNTRHWTRNPGVPPVPSNEANSLYNEVKAIDGVRDVQRCNAALDAVLNADSIYGGQDYEKVESARKLNESEYTLNTQLGFLSLKQQLNQDEVLAVAFEFTYGGKTYQVGELSTDGVQAPDNLILKMLKGTAVNPHTPLFKLMMKNVYYLGGTNVQQDKFKLQIQYKNDSSGMYVNYIPEGACANQLLIRVMNLDRLDIKNETNPDGKFDFVEGYTVYASSGRIIFPSPEPFGSFLRKKINNDAIADKYCFQELYDSTLVAAGEFSEKNKFRIAGEFQATSGSVIQLGAMNVPRGSVKVTTGGQELTENVDYTIDYTMGTVTILNQSILASGNNIDVQLENQNTFNMQRRTLVGTHLEYAITKDLSVGGTLMHLTEMPMVTKTAVGAEPIANTIWGVNVAYHNDAAWLTKAVDAIPGINATAPSSIVFNAEVAQLIPGHRKVDGNPGYAYLDDFESTETTIDLRYPYYWRLCATPYDENGKFPEATKSNNVDYGKNRALFNWYVIDNTVFNRDNSQTPNHLRSDKKQLSNHLTREVIEQELFPNKEAIVGQSSTLPVMNVSFYPKERGPYNLDLDVDPSTGKLLNPTNRWGGMFRRLETSDFETANIQYIKFWMMDPFVNDTNGVHTGGDLYFNLGDVSEDILKDGKKFFENGMPIDGSTTNTDTTVWGRVPTTQSTVLAFDGSLNSRKYQDVGLDGLRTEEEQTYPTYSSFVAALRAKLNPTLVSQMAADPYSPINDPASDNYHHFRGSDYDNDELGILARYKRYNNPEGNSPASDNTSESYSTSATTVPDAEDVNQDNTLNEYEKYFEYKVSLRHNDMEVGKNNIVDEIVTEVEMADGTKSQVTWYQFKIPINSYTKRVGSINNFRSIRFVRMYMTGFEEEMHLRFGTLELVRGEWKHYTKPLYDLNNPPTSTATLDVTSVSIEENANKEPVNYVLPPKVTRSTDPSQPQITQQNEQSMLIKVIGLASEDARAVYKNLRYDMRRYKRIQMFSHAEALINDSTDLRDYECSVFLRLGSDQTQNYYEYEIPLKLTPEGHYVKWDDNVWPSSNMFDFPLHLLTDIKNKRNASLRKTRGSMATPYSEYDPDNMQNKITIVGNPNLGEVKTMMIGVRNHANTDKSIEVWVNELRLTEFDEKPSWAATGNLGINFSDVGSFNVSARYEQAGFGSIEQSLSERRMDDLTQVNLSAQWDFGRFIPDKVNMHIPVYYSYGEEIKTPLYNPTDEDIKLKDALDALETKEQRDSLKTLSLERNITQSFNITNMKVDLKGKKARIWDPTNFSISYAFTQTKDLDPETMRDFTNSHNAQFNYNFSTTPESWEPFKTNRKLAKWKILTEWGLNYEPSVLAFNVNILRTYQETQLRDLTGDMGIDYSRPDNSLLSCSKDFTWSRSFQIKYDITKNISLQLQTNTNSRFDETKTNPVNKKLFPDEYEQWKDTVRKSVAEGGRPLAYQQTFTATWNVPINKLPEMDWVTAKAQYSATYNWSTGVVYDGTNSMGNTISNLAQWQGDGQMNFATLYGKSKYVKDLNNKLQQRSTGRGGSKSNFKEKTFTKTFNVSDTAAVKINHKLNSAKLDVVFTNKKGRVVDVKYRIIDNNNIEIRKGRARMDSVKMTIKTKDPNALNSRELAELYGVRILMLVRKLQVSYKGSSSIALPGYSEGGRFFGQTAVSGKLKPGLAFAFGVPSEEYIQNSLDNGWIIMNDSIINNATVNKTSDFDVKLSLEPIPNFKIELESKRVQSEMISTQQMYGDAPTTYSGSYRITTCMLASAFTSSGKAENNYHNKTFETFLDNRRVIADRIEGKYAGRQYPTSGFMSSHPLAGQTYDPERNGGVSLNSADVLIPAFLAAYSGTSPSGQSLDIFPGFLAMLPNWKITYDGFGKLKSMQKVFKSFTLTHSYQCTYNVGTYSSYTNYASVGGNMGFIKDVTTGNPVPSSQYNITSVNITESLNPLIGVDMAFKNSFTAKVEYKRQRTLTLNVSASQIMEAKNNEWVIGVGYVLKDFDVMLKLKQNKTKKVKNDLTLRCDFSIKDVATLLRKMDETFTTQATNGNKTFGFKFSAEYVFSSMLSFKLYCDYQNNAPYISTSYPVETCDFGLAVKFMLTR